MTKLLESNTKTLTQNICFSSKKETSHCWKSCQCFCWPWLLWSLYHHAKSREINLKEVLSYELSTVLSSFVHSDGSLRKKVQTFAAVWDGKDRECSTEIASWRLSFHSRWMAFIHMLKAGGASTFGALAESDYDLMTASFGQNWWKPVDVVSEQFGISL